MMRRSTFVHLSEVEPDLEGVDHTVLYVDARPTLKEMLTEPGLVRGLAYALLIEACAVGVLFVAGMFMGVIP